MTCDHNRDRASTIIFSTSLIYFTSRLCQYWESSNAQFARHRLLLLEDDVCNDVILAMASHVLWSIYAMTLDPLTM